MAKKRTARKPKPESSAHDESSAEDSSTPAAEPVPFEESLAELQQIVDRLESGELGLDDSLTEFERGIGLLRTCSEFLDRAERRVELLTGFAADGQSETAPFDATASTETGRSRTRREGDGESDSERRSLF